MIGETEGEYLNFENVPVVIVDLGRPVFTIGRRGILEWLRVELDFPNAQVKFIYPQPGASKYPHLASEFPKFEAALKSIEAQKIQEGIMMLAWDMERFLDRLTTEEEELKDVMDELPLSQRSIRRKFLDVCKAKKVTGLAKELDEFLNARNTAAHAKVYESWDKLSTESLLRSAEAIVSRLSSKVIASLHNQTPPEENFVGREEELKTITDWYKSKDVRIGALIGWGGVGKSALVRKWYDNLEANKIRPDGIFWWGFYRNAYLEQFLNALLRYVSGGQIEPETIKDTWEKVDRIKEYIGRGAYLIILDGLEQMQRSESGDKFGRMTHRECTELLHYLADTPKASGLCLITTRYPLKDLDDWHERGYENLPLVNLSIPDALSTLKKRGVNGSDDDIKEVVKRYKGHALSLTSVAGYLTRYYGGDIKHAPKVEFVLGDKERFKDVNKLLRRYAEKMSDAERVFLNIFSLFRQEVTERDFAGVFRKKIEGTGFNDVIVKMSELDFRDLINGLVDWRLISCDEEKKLYTTHPLIKSYFESDFEKRKKKICHKRIYQYFGEHAPQQPKTLEEMQPLFEQVYHGCAAGLYDEVFHDVYWEKIHRREEYFITQKLGAWETGLSLAKTFFPEGDLSQMPLVNQTGRQSWLLNEAGLALKNIGRPKEAEESFLTVIKMYIEEESLAYASVGYRNLADLRFRIGKVEAGLDSVKKALDLAEKAKDDSYIWNSKGYLGWILYLLGKTEEADKDFKKADELCIKITGYRIHSGWGVHYADFLIEMERIYEAFELTKRNLEICRSITKNPNDISRCYRCLGAIERIKRNHKKAEEHLEAALEIARKVGVTELEIEALLERGRLWLDMGKYEDAIGDANEVLKICGRTGFRLYEPGAEIVLARAELAQREFEQAENNAKSAYEKAVAMKYRWAEGDAAHLLGEIALAKEDKKEAQEWLKKAIKCRKEIKDPKVKDSERILNSASGG
jgi:tetratricopeptide (TPR) repeat protein